MSLREFLGIMWRRRWLLLVTMLIGAIAVLTIGRPSQAQRTTYTGSVTLTASGFDTEGVPLGLYAFVAAETNEIRQAVAADLGDEAYGSTDPVEVIAQTLTVQVIGELQALLINIDAQPSEATALAVLESFSTHLMAYGEADQAAKYQEDLAALDTWEQSLRERIDGLVAEMEDDQPPLGENEEPPTPDPIQEAELNVALDSLQNILVERDQLDSLTKSDLVPLVITTPPAILAEPAVDPPLGLSARLILGIVLGGVLGLGLAFGLHRFDNRIYYRKEAEAAFSRPVLAEVPMQTWRRSRRRDLVTRTRPNAAASEAYRLLRSSLARIRRLQLSVDESGPDPGQGTVVLIGSASDDVGKSTCAANLAVAAVDAGKKVLVVGADLRQPTIQRLFGLSPTKGLTDAIDSLEDSDSTVDLASYVMATPVEGIDLLPSGHPVTNPGERLAMARPFIVQARSRYDLIFLDTPAMLVGNDVTELIPMIDLMVAVARVGRSTIEECQWTTETAERVQAPLCGVVLIGSRSDLQPSVFSRFRNRLARRFTRADDPFRPTAAGRPTGSEDGLSNPPTDLPLQGRLEFTPWGHPTSSAPSKANGDHSPTHADDGHRKPEVKRDTRAVPDRTGFGDRVSHVSDTPSEPQAPINPALIPSERDRPPMTPMVQALLDHQMEPDDGTATIEIPWIALGRRDDSEAKKPDHSAEGSD